MAYQFPPDVDEQIKQRLSSGRYKTEDDVLRDALEALKMSEELAHFRASVADSRAQAERGEAVPLDVETVLNRAMSRRPKAS